MSIFLHLRQGAQLTYTSHVPTYLEEPLKLVEQIHRAGMKAGVAISPDTPSEAIMDEVANAADMLLVMTVYPGKH